jgi:hypothetical protein
MQTTAADPLGGRARIFDLDGCPSAMSVIACELVDRATRPSSPGSRAPGRALRVAISGRLSDVAAKADSVVEVADVMGSNVPDQGRDAFARNGADLYDVRLWYRPGFRS